MNYRIFAPDGKLGGSDRILCLDSIPADLYDHIIADPELGVFFPIGIYDVIVIKAVIAWQFISVVDKTRIYIVYYIRNLSHIYVAENSVIFRQIQVCDFSIVNGCLKYFIFIVCDNKFSHFYFLDI